ncbi:MAG: hypothetical protein KGM47_14260 [Acidobacteriota bacterium]|nr:hypothetical protein [Acidobacteriota bacterium]
MIGSEPTLAESASISAGETQPALFANWRNEFPPVITVKWGSRATPVPEWFPDVAARLVEFLRLPPYWDSYDALPIEPAAIERAVSLLLGLVGPDTPAPLVVPAVRGGVQFEWNGEETDLEIEITKDPSAGICIYEHASGNIWQGDLPEARDRVRQLLDRLSHK